jgi:hypothetical protein
MKAFAVGLLTASLLAIALAACESDDRGGFPGGGTPVSYGSAACSTYGSCSTCTPIQGCGWCYDSNGLGTCAPSPDFCATPSFSWTWNMDGCRIAAEAGVGEDAAAPAPQPEGGGVDARPESEDAPASVDGGDGSAVIEGGHTGEGGD